MQLTEEAQQYGVKCESKKNLVEKCGLRDHFFFFYNFFILFYKVE